MSDSFDCHKLQFFKIPPDYNRTAAVIEQMRHASSDVMALTATSWGAARTRVDEDSTWAPRFAKWKPFETGPAECGRTIGAFQPLDVSIRADVTTPAESERRAR